MCVPVCVLVSVSCSRCVCVCVCFKLGVGGWLQGCSGRGLLKAGVFAGVCVVVSVHVNHPVRSVASVLI